MNEMNYRMDWDERKQYVIDAIAEVLDNDTNAFVEICEELDNWNGFLGDARCYPMCEIDEFFNKPSELLDRMSDFDYTDEYFYFDVYGVTTASDKYDVYSDTISIDDIIDEIEDNYNHIDISNLSTLNELCAVLFREDFGIEEDWAYDEDMDEDDIPEETDEEFKERINDIM